jgi:hypothetical protein
VTIERTKIFLKFSMFLILPLSIFYVPNFAISIQNCDFFKKKPIYFTKTIDMRIKNIPFDSSRHGLSSDTFFKTIQAYLVYFFLIKRKKNCWQNFFPFLILPLHIVDVPNYANPIQNALRHQR